MLVAFAIGLGYTSLGARLNTAVPVTVLVVSARFTLWGCVGKGQD